MAWKAFSRFKGASRNNPNLSATSGADRKISCQLGLRAGRKRARLLVAHVNPLYFLVLVNGIDNAF
jgi:hypothetical protein